ncbi:MAG: hypothetical protein IJZ31_01910 [Bacteroidaceae bacterium]|nr:hypothetical protein [Bacteroidaceae bacterium]
MKKRFISFVSAIVVAFAAFAQVSEKAVQFTAVQDEASLVAGKRYIVVAEAEEGLVALSDQHNGTTPYRLQSNVLTESEGAIETVVATAAVEENLSVPYSLVLEGRAGEWKLYDEANEKYLHWTSKRSMELDDEGSVWTISINENGEAVIKLATEERTIRYGADDDRFACYTIGQTAVKLYEPAVQNAFFAAYANFMMLTETCSSMWMIPAVSEKFFALQEAGSAVNDSIWETPVEDIASLTETIVEATAYVQAMHAKYNEFKNLLFLCYDYQDNSTASDEVIAAFAEVVDLYAGYQWSFPAATVEEFDVMIKELKEASLAYAFEATPNDGFEFEGVVYVESAWVGTLPEDSLATYIYNPTAKAFLAAGNSWGTQASFTETGIEWLIEGADNVYTLDGKISNGGTSHYFTGTYTDGAATDVVLELVGKNLFTLKVGDNYIAYDGTNVVANVAEVNDGCYWQFVTKAERQALYATATAIAPADATFEISGANFGRNDGANSAWSGSPALGGANENFCAEKWNAGIVEVAQVLRNMPAGTYRLSAQGFYRMGDMGPAAEARTNGTEVLNAKFFANGDSVAIMSVMEEAGKLEGVGNSGYTGYGLAPNSMGEASQFFGAGYYEHSLIFTLEAGVDTIKLGATKTGSVDRDWMIFDNFRLEYFGAAGEENFLGNGVITSMPEGDHYVYYTDAEGGLHFLNAAGTNNWVVSDVPTVVTFSAGNTTEDPYAGYASFMAVNGFYMSNAANSDGSGAIKTETIDGGNGSKKRTWESQVFYKNAAGKHAIRLTNSKGTSWGANCFVNIDPTTLAVASGQPTLGDALYLWEVASVDDPRFTTEALKALIEAAEALDGACNKAVKAELDAAVAAAKEATTEQVPEIKATLEAAIEAVEASIADYVAIVKEVAACEPYLIETATGFDDFAEVVELAVILTEGGDATAETLVELQEAKATFLAANEVAGALVNGTFGDASAASVDGWTQEGGEMGKTGNHNKWTNVNDGFFEQWQNTLPDVEIYQEISGLPAGTYTFAAYVVACQQSNDDSHEVSGVNLFANSDSVAIHTINVDRNAANQAIGAELALVTTTIAEGETLKVGMSVKGTDANWVVIDNAKLYCFGKTSGIQTVELGEVAGREFFNAAGVAVDAPVQGITIVKTTYTNGVVKVSKVFVK